MKLADLPTPCLVLDRTILERNIATMATALTRHGVPLRPHMKTAKSIDVARLAIAGPARRHHRLDAGRGGVFRRPRHHRHPLRRRHHAAETRSGGQAEQRRRLGHRAHRRPRHGGRDRRAPTAAAGADRDRHRRGPRRRSAGRRPAARDRRASGPLVWSACMTHAGHSYAARGVHEITGDRRRTERSPVGRQRLRRPVSAPTSSRAAVRRPRCMRSSLTGVTEVRAGVYMFGDLFQAEIGTHTVGRDRGDGADQCHRTPAWPVLVDAGGLALSKDRSTEATPNDYGFGLALDIAGSEATASHRAASVSGARRDRGRSGASDRLADRREASHRPQSHLHDHGGA